VYERATHSGEAPRYAQPTQSAHGPRRLTPVFAHSASRDPHFEAGEFVAGDEVGHLRSDGASPTGGYRAARPEE